MPDGTKQAQEETGAALDQNEELKEEKDEYPDDEAEKEAFSESKFSENESLIDEFGEERDIEAESESESESEPEKNYMSSSESSDDDMDYIGKGGTYRVPAKYLRGKTEKEKRNIRSFTKLHFQHYGKDLKREEERDFSHSRFDFPPDPENWREKDLMELWALGPPDTEKTGWDPADVDAEDIEKINEMIEMGLDPPIAPFYLPYFRRYPVVPRNHADIRTPKDVVEELDRIEEFLVWDSYIFADGSSYEGTVWDDLAHGKGVYIAEDELLRYEGEWVRNDMEGHGVIEVDIPGDEPYPGSMTEERMREEGHIIKRDYMSPEEREWLEMDLEDNFLIFERAGVYETPWYENDEWIAQYGRYPEKGRYRYAGQWKHGRMHGCGIYEVNERMTFGRFYFGELLEGPYGCDEDVSAMHAGIAEIAAAKARMFTRKPDGMVREKWGPFSDPQHPYFYEEDDVWMAPGFINQFYEVPAHWKKYVHEVDEEREMWLNSFYKSPLRIPMPAELEYLWSRDEPEFVLINKAPEPDPKDPSKMIYTESPLILHTPSGRIINYVDDDEYGLRLFWQPPLDDGEKMDPSKVEFLPLGFDEFFGKVIVEEEEKKVEVRESDFAYAMRTMRNRLKNWIDEKKQAIELKRELREKELDFAEAELSLKEAIEDLDAELKRMQDEEEKNSFLGLKEEDGTVPAETQTELEEASPVIDDEKEEEKEVEEDGEKVEEEVDKEEEEDEEEEDEDEEVTPSSFGSIEDQEVKDEPGRKNAGTSPFAASSLGFVAPALLSTVPSKLWQSFTKRKEVKSLSSQPCGPSQLPSAVQSSSSVSFPRIIGKGSQLRVLRKRNHHLEPIYKSRSTRQSKYKATTQLQRAREENFSILSWHSPLQLQSPV